MALYQPNSRLGHAVQVIEVINDPTLARFGDLSKNFVKCLHWFFLLILAKRRVRQTGPSGAESHSRKALELSLGLPILPSRRDPPPRHRSSSIRCRRTDGTSKVRTSANSRSMPGLPGRRGEVCSILLASESSIAFGAVQITWYITGRFNWCGQHSYSAVDVASFGVSRYQ